MADRFDEMANIIVDAGLRLVAIHAALGKGAVTYNDYMSMIQSEKSDLAEKLRARAEGK